MSHIQQLPNDVISAIAAGEVIEQPVDIVKELIENSLDAAASKIVIKLTAGGTDTITITDNGHGIMPSELIAAVMPHCTSKLSNLRDFAHLSSLGFRGEGLASIKASANLTITSRHSSSSATSAGHSISVSNGTIVKSEQLAHPVGTTVVVKELFARLPVRKKFLHSVSHSLYSCAELITKCALSHHYVHFKLMNNNSLIFDYPATSTTEARILQLFGQESIENSISIQHKIDTLYLNGWLTIPHATQLKHEHQYLFLNHRPITFPALNNMLKKAFGSTLHARKKPAFVLMLQTPPKYFDVNAHPKKHTVVFYEQAKLLSGIETQLRTSLEQFFRKKAYRFTPAINDTLILSDSLKTTDQSLHQQLKDTTALSPLSKSQQADMPEIISISNTYLAYSDSDQDALVIVDFHAAHERILFEEFKKSFELKNAPSHILAYPITISLSASQFITFQQAEDTFQHIGFVTHITGPQHITISATPALVQDHTVREIIIGVLSDLASGQQLPEVSEYFEHVFAFLACRSAVQSGDQLAAEQKIQLLQQLSNSNNNISCPHGRPTVRMFSSKELAKLFQRI